jgi:hypothetical protein
MVKYSLGILVIALSMGSPAIAQNPNIPSSTGPSNPNTSGSFFAPDRQYMVYLKDLNQLPQVKTIVTDAFISNLDSGARVIQIGRYNNQNLAQRQLDQLKARGINAEIAPVTARVATTTQAPATSLLTFDGTSSTNIATDIPSPPGSRGGFQTSSGFGTDLVPLPGVPYTPNSGLSSGQSNPLSPKDKSIEINRGLQSGINPSPDAPSPLGVKDTIATSPTPVRNRYYVIVPSSLESVLQKARAIAPTARMAVSERGTYVELQGFSDRGSADTLTRTVRSQGLDARVIYF